MHTAGVAGMKLPTFSTGCCSFLLLLALTQAAAANEVTNRVRVYWPGGAFEIDLYGEDSPRHVANFLQYVDDGTYDYTYTHRSVSMSSRFLQGGAFYYFTPFSPSTMHYYQVPANHGTIKNEFDASNGLSNTSGTLAAARTSDPDSASAGWFINVTDNSAGFDPGPYTVYGEVSSGWELLSSLVNYPMVQDVFTSYDSDVRTAPVVNFGTTEDPDFRPPAFYKWVRAPLVTGDFNLDGVVDSADETVWEASQGDLTTGNLTADANGDWVVDDLDLAILYQHMGEGALQDLPGDFNGNGIVNEADYLWWKTQFGSTTSLDADGNGDGMVDLADYAVWRNNLGATTLGSVGAVAGTSVPEPATGLMAIGALIALFGHRAKKAGLE